MQRGTGVCLCVCGPGERETERNQYIREREINNLGIIKREKEVCIDIENEFVHRRRINENATGF